MELALVSDRAFFLARMLMVCPVFAGQYFMVWALGPLSPQMGQVYTYRTGHGASDGTLAVLQLVGSVPSLSPLFLKIDKCKGRPIKFCTTLNLNAWCIFCNFLEPTQF